MLFSVDDVRLFYDTLLQLNAFMQYCQFQHCFTVSALNNVYNMPDAYTIGT